VVEIGPGKGALTAKLLERAARVVAVELDPAMVDCLHARFAHEPRLEVVPGDVLKTDLGQWGPAAIAGNLPYYITSPILSRIAATGGWKRAVLLVQKEVAERLAAPPGCRDYGYLTLQTQFSAHVSNLFEVKPGAFHPPPKVDSAVVRLDPWDGAAELGIADAAGFLEFAGRAFRQKRKTLRNNLAADYGSERIALWPEAGLRAEQLPLEKFAELYRRLVS
jgi:16S rRNA (adenine1518-N6/adenine1519-N6)-dimethyltransferase